MFRYRLLPEEVRVALEARLLAKYAKQQTKLASEIVAVQPVPPSASSTINKTKGIQIVKRNNDMLLEGKLQPAMTLNEAAEVWKTVMKFSVGSISYIAPGTLGDYTEKLKPLCRHFGPKRLGEIYPDDLREYQQLRASGALTDPSWKKPRTMAGPGPAAYRINKEVEFLIRILLRAKAWTPEMAEVYVPLKIEMRDIPRAMSPTEQRRFLSVAASKEEWATVHWYATLALHTCMSTLEMRNLRRRDISLDQGIVVVRARGAKNPYRIRTIPLDSDARQAASWLMSRATQLRSTDDEHHVFPFRDKQTRIFDPTRPMSESGLNYHWGQVRQAADLPWLRPYDLRHTAITRFAEAGTSIPVIMEFAGHVSPRMTAHYTHISQQAKIMAAHKAGEAALGKASTINVPIPNGASNGGGGGVNLGALITNLKAAGIDPDSILQILQASSS